MRKRTHQTSFSSPTEDSALVPVSFDAGIEEPTVCTVRYTIRNIDASTYHISDFRIMIVDHRVLERLQEIFLKFEVRQLFFFKESHGELPKGVQCKEANVRIIVTAHLHSIRKHIGIR